MCNILYIYITCGLNVFHYTVVSKFVVKNNGQISHKYFSETHDSNTWNKQNHSVSTHQTRQLFNSFFLNHIKIFKK